MRILVLTDAKIDDFLALKAICYKFKKKKIDVTIDIVITDIYHIDAAYYFLSSLIHDSNVNFYRGIKSDEPKSHEKYLFQINKTTANADLPLLTGNHSYYVIFLLSPFFEFATSPKYYKYFYEPNSVMLGLGYNCACKSKHIMKNLLESWSYRGIEVYVLNNVVSFTGEEGGRFPANSKLWDQFPENARRQLLNSAIEDSMEFIGRQFAKSQTDNPVKRDFLTHEVVTQLKMGMDDELYKLFLNENFVNKTYKARILDQLDRKTIDIECTDLQHVVVFLENMLGDIQYNIVCAALCIEDDYIGLYIPVKENHGQALFKVFRGLSTKSLEEKIINNYCLFD